MIWYQVYHARLREHMLNRSESLVFQWALLKPCLVNLKLKATHLVFSIYDNKNIDSTMNEELLCQCCCTEEWRINTCRAKGFSVAIIMVGERELVAILCLSSWCRVIVIGLWFFLTVPWVGLWYHLLFGSANTSIALTTPRKLTQMKNNTINTVLNAIYNKLRIFHEISITYCIWSGGKSANN